MKWIFPSILVYGFIFLLGYTVRTAFQESHYPVVPRKIVVKTLSSLKLPEEGNRPEIPIVRAVTMKMN